MKALQFTVRVTVLAACVLWDVRFVQATAIVIVRSPNEIFIGADSKRTINEGARSTSVCKVVVAGQAVTAIAGVTSTTKPPVDLQAVVRNALRSGGTFGEKLPLLNQALKRPIELIAGRVQIDPHLKWKYRGKLFEEIAVAGLDHAVPVIALSLYKLAVGEDSTVSVSVSRSVCPPRCKGTGDNYTFTVLGETDAIMRDLRQDESFSTSDVAARIDRLITLQSRETPESVAPPINIVHLTRQGLTWIQRSPECE